MTFLKELILCTISWLFAFPLLLIFLPILLIFIAYKSVVNLIVQFKHPTWTPLSDLDIAINIGNDLYASEGKFLGNLGFLIVINDPHVDVQIIRQEFQKNILNLMCLKSGDYRYDRLRKYPVKFMFHYYWRDVERPKLNLNELIKERHLVEKTDLVEFLEDWLHKGYESGAPMWEIVLYKDSDDYAGKTVLGFKMAHGLGDGHSAMNLIARFFGATAPDVQIGAEKWFPFWEKVVVQGLP